MTCPKCQSPMQEGYQLDESYAKLKAAEWVDGKPQRSFWTGLKLGDHPRREIVVYRCEACGFLENYAK